MATIQRGQGLLAQQQADAAKKAADDKASTKSFIGQGQAYGNLLNQDALAYVKEFTSQARKETPLTASALSSAAIVADTNQRNNELAWYKTAGPKARAAEAAANPAFAAAMARLNATAAQPQASPLLNQLNTEAAGATGLSPINSELQDQALSELHAGGYLTPDQQRNVEQDTRAAYAARGLHLSNAAAVTEVENLGGARDARQQQRQQFASGVESQVEGQQGQDRQFQSNVAGLDEASVNAYRGYLLNVAQADQADDPAMHLLGMPTHSDNAVNTAASIGMGAQQQTGQILGLQDQYSGTLLNQAAQEDIANKNRQAGLQSAQMQASAASDAGNSSMVGAGIGVGVGLLALMLICWLAREVYGLASPDWLLFRWWLTKRAPLWLLRLYVKHGERAAKWVHAHPWSKAPLRFLMNHGVRAARREMRHSSHSSSLAHSSP